MDTSPEPNQRKIKFGVIGLGHIGIKHIDAIINNRSSELIAIADKYSFKEIAKYSLQNFW